MTRSRFRVMHVTLLVNNASILKQTYLVLRILAAERGRKTAAAYWVVYNLLCSNQ